MIHTFPDFQSQQSLQSPQSLFDVYFRRLYCRWSVDAKFQTKLNLSNIRGPCLKRIGVTNIFEFIHFKPSSDPVQTLWLDPPGSTVTIGKVVFCWLPCSLFYPVKEHQVDCWNLEQVLLIFVNATDPNVTKCGTLTEAHPICQHSGLSICMCQLLHSIHLMIEAV